MVKTYLTLEDRTEVKTCNLAKTHKILPTHLKTHTTERSNRASITEAIATEDD